MASSQIVEPGITVKAQLLDELRRFSLPLAPSPTFPALYSLITKVFGDGFPAMTVKYRDDEGDLVTLSTDADLHEALSSCKGPNAILRLVLEASSPSSPPPSLVASISSSSAPSPSSASTIPSTSTFAPVLYNGKPYVPQGTYKPDPTLIDLKKSPSPSLPSSSPSPSIPSSIPSSSPSPSIAGPSPSSIPPSSTASSLNTVASLSASTAAMVRALSASTSRDTIAQADLSSQHTLEASIAHNPTKAPASSSSSFSEAAEITAQANLLTTLSDRTRDESHALAVATSRLVDPLAKSTRDAQFDASDAIRDQLNRDVENLKALLAATTV